MRIECCPFEYGGEDVSALFEMIDFADKGQLPIEGGVLSQTQSFLDALRFARQGKGPGKSTAK